jgi:superfamily I DNA and/or RNA helicase
MYTIWTSHLDEEATKDRFRMSVSAAKTILDRLKDIISEREQVINSIETGVEIYSKPGWDALLAHYNGEKAALKFIKKLIDLDQQKETFNDRRYTAPARPDGAG